MRRMIFMALACLLFFNISCKDEPKVYVQKICRIEKNNEIDIYLRNNTDNNYYILGAQCQLDNGIYYPDGVLDSSDYKNFAIIDSIAKKVYKFVDKTPSGKEKAIPVIFLKSRQTVKLKYKFNRDIKSFGHVSVDFPANERHRKLKEFSNELKNIKLDSDYNFYAGKIENFNNGD